MTLIARLIPASQEEMRQITVRASSPAFVDAFFQGYQVCCSQGRGQPLTDDQLFVAIHAVMSACQAQPRVQAGQLCGWFAACYGVAYQKHELATFRRRLVLPPRGTHVTPPLQVQYHDRVFAGAYHWGYQAFGTARVQEITDTRLAEVLVGTSHLSTTEPTRYQQRWCAGYISGSIAALFAMPSFFAERLTLPTLSPRLGEGRVSERMML